MDYSVSIILPVINETFSLRQTFDILESQNSRDIKEYLVIICDRTTPESLSVINELKKNHADKIIVHNQKMKFLGGAVREAIEIATGTHLVMMATDLETDPNLVKEFIALSKKNPEMIITATRWKSVGGFKGYDPFKLVMNWIFQKFFSALYRTKLSDMTFGFRIFPTALLKSLVWTELRHPFLFETVLKPLRLGVKVIEIPSTWEARKEGESQNPFLVNFLYFKTGLRIFFLDKSKIKKQS